MATRRLLLLLTILAASACDRGEGAAPAAAKHPGAAKTPQPKTPQGVDPEPAAPSFEAQVATLIAGSEPSATAEQRAWTHYKAKQYPEAQRLFALASLHDRVGWKHPFNLACASALAKDEAMVRVALAEAVTRDADAAAAKARKDGDLKPFRDAPWFEQVLRAEPVAPSDAEVPPDAASTEAPGLPPGVAQPLAAAELARLRGELELHHGLRPVIRGSLEISGAAYLVYDYTRYDACLKTSGKQACREKLGAGEDDEGPSLMQCTQQWLVRAQLGATPKLGEPQALDVGCIIEQLRLDALDLDGDGEAEIVLDARGMAELEGFREAAILNAGRVVRILRADGSAQFEFSMHWEATDMAPSGDTAKRVVVRDVNADGHVDLIVESMQFVAFSGRSFDSELWPSDDDEEEEEDPPGQEIWLYDAAADRWAK